MPQVTVADRRDVSTLVALVVAAGMSSWAGPLIGLTAQAAPTGPVVPWEHAAMHASAPQLDGSGVVVAIIDSGVDSDHPGLVGRVLPGYDAISGLEEVSHDRGFHGTLMATILAASSDSGVKSGVAPGALVLPIFVGRDGVEDPETLTHAIVYAVDHGADVVSISSIGYQPHPLEDAAIEYAEENGVLVVAAAGNADDRDPTTPVPRPGYPAAYEFVVGAGATTAFDQRQPYSNRGSYVDIVAPSNQGTSGAAPRIAGVAAMILQANPDLTPAEVRLLLTSTARDVGPSGRDDGTGAGIVSVASIECALLGACGPTPSTPPIEWRIRTRAVDREGEGPGVRRVQVIVCHQTWPGAFTPKTPFTLRLFDSDGQQVRAQRRELGFTSSCLRFLARLGGVRSMTVESRIGQPVRVPRRPGRVHYPDRP